jgi:hypothetical protein
MRYVLIVLIAMSFVSCKSPVEGEVYYEETTIQTRYIKRHGQMPQNLFIQAIPE